MPNSAKQTNRHGGETAVKVLLFDIESSPNIAYLWGKYEQNALGDFIRERQIICFAWKWLGEKKTHCLSLPMLRGYRRNPDDNRALILKLHSLMSQADVVVAHNVDGFDDKMANTDFIVNGLKPPKPHKTVDTLKVARSKFRFNSNKLDDLGARLGLGRKVHTGGFALWAGCLRGDMKSWNLMERYNRNDVDLLEKVYLRLRPWMSNHPNMNALDGRSACPICRAPAVRMIVRKHRMTATGKKIQFQCRDCGKFSTGDNKSGTWEFK